MGAVHNRAGERDVLGERQVRAVDHDGGVAELDACGDLVEAAAVVQVHPDVAVTRVRRVQSQTREMLATGIAEAARASLEDDGHAGRLRHRADRLCGLQVVGREAGNRRRVARCPLQHLDSVKQHQRSPRSTSTTSARAPSSPTLPANTTYGIPGATPSTADQTETIPGSRVPRTQARRMPRPRVATSLDVMPPFATTNRGMRTSVTARTTSTSDAETCRAIARLRTGSFAVTTCLVVRTTASATSRASTVRSATDLK